MTEHMVLWLVETSSDLVIMLTAIVVAFLIVVSILVTILRGIP